MNNVERSPVVSVLVTAYNRELFIGDAIESVLRSTFEDFEVIVVDDASTDRTAEVAARFAASDPRVRVFVNETNLGDYANRNRVAGYASGKYLKYLDSDDVIYPHGLGVMVACMEAFPSAALGLSALPDRIGPYPRQLTPAEAYRENFAGHDILGRAPGSAIIRRAIFEAVGGFSGIPQVGDHELWLRIARTHPIVKMPAHLIWDRQHPHQEKNADSDMAKAIKHTKVAREALLAKDCPLSANERDVALAQIDRNGARLIWQLLPRGGGIRAAREFRRGASIPPRAIAGIALGAISAMVNGRRSP